MKQENCTAVIVTKGDPETDWHAPRTLEKVLGAGWRNFRDVIVWDNSRAAIDLKVLGRFVAMMQSKTDFIYTQDDDCIVSYKQIIDDYDRDHIVANMPEDRRGFYNDGVALIGWGAVFHRELASSAFKRYLDKYALDDLFLRECDRVFTGLNTVRMVDVPYRNLPSAHGADRMGEEKRHLEDLAEIRRRIYSIR